MSLFWWKIHLRTAAAAWRVFGLDRRTLIYAVRRPMAMGLARFALALDHVFYPAFRSTAVRKPVFILGHPRSGTTFLQHLLTQTGEFCAFAAWEIFVPSLTARALIRRAIARRIAEGRTTFFPAEMGHQVALDQIEEDELLLIYTSNTELVSTISPLAFGDWDFSELVYADAQPEPLRRKTMAFLRGCYQRQVYATGRPQVLAKMTYSAMRLRSLLAEFPDARIVYVVRSPFETLPSFFSLERNLFAHMWGEVSIPRDLMERYYRRRYASSLAYYRYVEDLMASGALPPTHFMAVSYDELRGNLTATVDRIARFAGLELSPELRERIAKQESQQKSYQRRHANLGLEEFGLTEERVRTDFADVFDKYGFER